LSKKKQTNDLVLCSRSFFLLDKIRWIVFFKKKRFAHSKSCM